MKVLNLFDMFALRSLSTSSLQMSGSKYLISYLSSGGTFTFSVDGLGNSTVDNQGSSGVTNDLLLATGRGLDIVAPQSVSIPIHHTLGAENYSNTYAQNTRFVYTPITNGVTISGTSITNANDSWIMGLDIIVPSVRRQKYKIEFNAVVNSGIYTITHYYNGTEYVSLGYSKVITNGINTIEVPSRNITASRITFSTYILGQAFNISITEVSVKQITNPNS